MKRILALRHSRKWPDANREGWYIPLSLKGVLLAVDTGRRLRNPYHFTMLMTSATVRAMLTAILIMLGMKKIVPLRIRRGVGTPWPERWKGVYRQVKATARDRNTTTLASFKEVDPQLYNEELKRVKRLYNGLFQQLKTGQTILVVGHTIFIELAVVGLTGQEPKAVPALAECDGYILTLEKGRFTAERFIKGL